MRTVDVDGNEVEIETHGRHDPCVGIRAVPVGEAMVACVLADHLRATRARRRRLTCRSRTISRRSPSPIPKR